MLTIGGIRSTGLSGCIGIGDHVLTLVRDKFSVEASCTKWNTINPVDFNFTGRGTVTFPNGIEHYIAHPLTFTGINKQSEINPKL